MYDIEKIRRSSEPIGEYLRAVLKDRPAFAERYREYLLDAPTVEELKRYAEGYMIVVFSAEWCKDCARNVPVLGLLSEATGMEIRVFGHLIRDPLSPGGGWRIPPSPPEVKEFEVNKIPLIVILSRDGDKVGEIVENPPGGVSLEKAILSILKRA